MIVLIIHMCIDSVFFFFCTISTQTITRKCFTLILRCHWYIPMATYSSSGCYNEKKKKKIYEILYQLILDKFNFTIKFKIAICHK